MLTWGIILMSYKINSMVCCYEHLSTDWFKRWHDALGYSGHNSPKNRKIWEWCAISQALYERGKLGIGKSGIGFAVGNEPLPSLFANLGSNIVATDLGTDINGWGETGQHAKSLNDLLNESIVKKDVFFDRVRFEPADMNSISHIPKESYDFTWSSCALEHLGGLQNGLDFITNSIDLLKPGGVAVHTTEYNVSSNTDTISDGWNVLYRKCDMEQLAMSLRKKRVLVERFNFFAGDRFEDMDYDEEPYFRKPYHIKLLLGGYVSTSFVIVAQKLI